MPAQVAPVSATSEVSAQPAKSDPPRVALPLDAPRNGRPCGELGCLAFASAEDAFAHVLATEPRVLAIGEAHAQRGSEGIDSATKRFSTALLGRLGERASDLVIEVTLPPKEGCDAEKRSVVLQVEKPVTKTQRTDNKNEFVALGLAAKARGLTPWALEPSCEELRLVASGGDDAIDRMLTLIAVLTEKRLLQLHERREPDRLLVAYGGALHNDVMPAAERAAWSFGPALVGSMGARYVELDLIVPEYISDSDVWRRLPWMPHYDRAKNGHEVILFRPAARSFTLVFAESSVR